MQRPEHLQLAFVLHRRDYSNTSLLLELFVSGSGRLPAIAKGAKRKGAASSALLQPFQPLWLGTAGRGEVRTLTRVEAAGPPLGLQGRALVSGFYLNELLVRLLGRHDPHDALFAFYQAALSAVAGAGDLETTLRQFELRLLDELGYGLTLDRLAASGAKVEPHLTYLYDSDQGLRLAVQPQPESGPWLSGATLLALASGEPLTESQRREARRLLRSVLEPHLGERPLQSRELYRRWIGNGG